MSRKTTFAIAALASGVLVAVAARAQDTDAAWRALAGDGAVALIRHAKAPGPSPDPPGARRADCATQRNLSPAGRAQAAKLGALWRAAGQGRQGDLLALVPLPRHRAAHGPRRA